jgi:transcriptional regulator
VAVHAYGAVEFFTDEARLHDAVSRLTALHEAPRENPWAVTDAPEPFIKSQLKGIVGLRLVISRIEGKVKMSQNRPEADRQGVAAGWRQARMRRRGRRGSWWFDERSWGSCSGSLR